MASTFFGRFDHSLDSKGRVILPARFRSAFDATAFITAHDGRCLALWTPDGFEVEFERVVSRQDLNLDARNFARMWTASTSEEKLDAQGRIMIPVRLREYAGLEMDSPVVVIGSGDRIELWNPERWDADVGRFEDALADANWRMGSDELRTPTGAGE